MLTMKNRTRCVIALIATLTCLSASVLAQDRDQRRGHEPERGRRPKLELDQRYEHNHYYPRHGAAVTVLPRGSVSIAYGGGNYFYQRGVWFRPSGRHFVTGLPPLGIVVPILPPAYATIWFSGSPYYYANSVYYAPMPGQGYRVVAPPAAYAYSETMQAVPTPTAPAATQMYTEATAVAPQGTAIYPRNAQTAAQTEADIKNCNQWANTQADADFDASVFQRAFAACMDARGYTLR